MTYFLMKELALDHKNNMARASIKPWQTKVSKWYSNNSNRTQIAVAPTKSPPDIFLSLHKKTLAAAPTDQNDINERETKTSFLTEH